MRINYIPLSPSVSHAKFESTSFPLNLEILVSEFWPLTRVHNIGETGCCSHLWRWALLAPLGSYNLKIYWQILGFTFPMWWNLFLFFLLSLSWKSTGSVVGWLENFLIYSECLSLHFLAWAKKSATYTVTFHVLVKYLWRYFNWLSRCSNLSSN